MDKLEITPQERELILVLLDAYQRMQNKPDVSFELYKSFRNHLMRFVKKNNLLTINTTPVLSSYLHGTHTFNNQFNWTIGTSTEWSQIIISQEIYRKILSIFTYFPDSKKIKYDQVTKPNIAKLMTSLNFICLSKNLCQLHLFKLFECTTCNLLITQIIKTYNDIKLETSELRIKLLINRMMFVQHKFAIDHGCAKQNNQYILCNVLDTPLLTTRQMNQIWEITNGVLPLYYSLTEARGVLMTIFEQNTRYAKFFDPEYIKKIDNILLQII